MRPLKVELFKKVCSRVTPNISFAGTAHEDTVMYDEWQDFTYRKYKGMCKPDGSKHGVLRSYTVKKDYKMECSEIVMPVYSSYLNDTLHGLSLTFERIKIDDNDWKWCIEVSIYDNGDRKGFIIYDGSFEIVRGEWIRMYISNNRQWI